MTGPELTRRIENFRLFKKALVELNLDEIYPAANDVQTELCSELKLLEEFCTLRLVAGQERYQFPAVTITDVQGSNPVTITGDDHSFNTGDTVVIAGVGGKTLVNGRHSVTKQDADNFTVPVTDATAYTTGGTAYHGLNAAVETLTARKLTSPYGLLVKKTPDWIEQRRFEFGDNVTNDKLRYFYEVADEPYIFGVQGIPKEDTSLELKLIRKPLASEDISDTVAAILPRQYDRLLYLGTLRIILQDHQEEKAEKYFKEIDAEYDNEKLRWRSINIRRRMPRPQGRHRLKW